jgi:hypothetical protein
MYGTSQAVSFVVAVGDRLSKAFFVALFCARPAFGNQWDPIFPEREELPIEPYKNVHAYPVVG